MLPKSWIEDFVAIFSFLPISSTKTAIAYSEREVSKLEWINK